MQYIFSFSVKKNQQIKVFSFLYEINYHITDVEKETNTQQSQKVLKINVTGYEHVNILA